MNFFEETRIHVGLAAQVLLSDTVAVMVGIVDVKPASQNVTYYFLLQIVAEDCEGPPCLVSFLYSDIICVDVEWKQKVDQQKMILQLFR